MVDVAIGEAQQALSAMQTDGASLFSKGRGVVCGEDVDNCRRAEGISPAGPTTEPARRWLALAVVFLIAGSQTAASQMTKSAQVKLRAPFFVMYVHTGLMTLCLPCSRLLAPAGSRIAASAFNMLIFLSLWIIANYCYTNALRFAQPGLVQTLFGCGPAVVALLSRVVLREPVTHRRLISGLLALAGAAAVGSAASWDTTGHTAATGALFGFASVVAAAAYKVSFKARLGEPAGWVVLGFSGTIGIVAAILGLPVTIFLSATSREDAWWSSHTDVNWLLIFGGGLLDVVYNVSIAFGLSISSPLFVALGAILSIPMNLSIDALLRGVVPTPAEGCGALLIAASFALLVCEESRGHGAVPPRDSLQH